MTLPLYFAPINTLGNAPFRHILLTKGADFVFSELLMAQKLHEEYYKRKLQLPPEDISKTIFQIGAGTKEEVTNAVSFLTKQVSGIKEINLNMGCPQSTLQKNNVCGGLLLRQDLMRNVATTLVIECKKNNILPSVKLRLGTDEEHILITDYTRLLSDAGIQKIYIHLRPLRYNYTHPVLISPVIGLQEKFPNIAIILNGDIDCFQSYKELTSKASCKGVMIGRAALSNLLIFEQIKREQPSTQGPYDPLAKDSELVQKGQHIVMSETKKQVILEFLALSDELPLSVVKSNLSYLTKGVSARGAFIGAISPEKDKTVIIERFKDHFFS